VKTEHQFAHQVILMLFGRGVSHAYVAVSSKSREVFQTSLRQITLAADSIQWLERPTFSYVAQVRYESFAFTQIAQTAKSFNHECSIPQPAVAIIPTTFGTHCFWNGGS